MTRVGAVRGALWAGLLWGGPGCVFEHPDQPSKDEEEVTDTDAVETDVTDATTDTDPQTDAPSDTDVGADCSVLPPTPVTWHTLTGFGGSEDFDIDADGYLVRVDSNGNLVGRNQAGQTRLMATGVSNASAGTRILPNGSVVVCRVGQGSLVRVDPNGAKVVIASNLAYPNGLEVDEDGYVYVAENSGGKVRQIDPMTMDQWIVADNVQEPNGVVWSPDYQTLYVGTFGPGILYSIKRTGLHTFEPAQVLAQNNGWQGGYDGINVDECGNIYVTEYIAGKVWRLTPDASDIRLAAELPSSWIPNMRWGNGVGGWEEDTLYVMDLDQGRVFGLELGLEGKKAVYWP